MKTQNLMILYDIRYSSDPQNIHYQEFIKKSPRLMRALEAWKNKAANDDNFDVEGPAHIK